MASLGHVAVGMVAARLQGGRVPRASSMAAWSALSLLPDLDVVGFMFGVEYGDPWGHRGATHSLALSVALGLAIGLAARRFDRPALRTAVVASAVLASHAFLDTLTDGGLGCALLWPFDLTRYFAPWRPIPVAPIGLDLVTKYGAMVLLAELLLFAPAIVFALRPRSIGVRSAVFGLALWLGCVSAIGYSDRTREAITGFLLREDTVYAPGFSEPAFDKVTAGQSASDVRRRLGSPLSESWFYMPLDARPPDERAAPQAGGCLALRVEADVVVLTYHVESCTARGVEKGLSSTAAEGRLGPPSEICWAYTRGAPDGHHRERLVCFANGKVHMVVRRWS
jgi:inner membrane protein